MALTDNNVVMPVSPMGYGNGFGGDGAWWLIVLFLFAASGNGFGGGMGGNMAWPYFTAQNTDAAVQRGFDTAALTSQLSGINTSISNGFASAEAAECNRAMDAMQTAYGNQIASMNQNFASQTAIDGRLDSLAMSLQNYCCENRASVADLKYSLAQEACNTRFADANNTRDIIENCNRNNQAVLDKLCQLELDEFKRENMALQNQLNMAAFRESQAAQDNYLQNALTAQTMYLRPPINPAFIVNPPYQAPSTGGTTTTAA